MKARVAINGFGRIGRMFMRAALGRADFEVVAVNASYDAATLAHLLKYDTVHGRFPDPVAATDGGLRVGDRDIRLVSEREPDRLPWEELGIDIVVEATGKFRAREEAARHLRSGAKRVLITAPGKGEDALFVYGVNHRDYDPARHYVISAASCTTNCVGPVAAVLHRHFQIRSGLMTTVHSYTSDQRFLDNPHKDLRRARAAALAMVPTKTGAARAIGQVIPELEGRLNGFAVRVPTPDVSLVDLVAQCAAPVSKESVNAALREAAEGDFRGIIAYSEEPLVSTDYIGDPHSAIVDGPLTMVGPHGLVKVVAWYDNEYGYSCRLADLTGYVAARTFATAGATAR